MSTVATLAVKVTADLTQLSSNLDKAEKQFVKTADKLSSLGEKLATRVTLPLVALGGFIAKSAAEDIASVQQMEHVFGAGARGMEVSLQKIGTVSKATDDELRGMAVSTQTVLRSLGMAPAQAQGMTVAVTQLAADLAAFKNVSQDVAQDALEKALMGKTRGLTQFGIAISEADVKQQAYRMGLAKVGSELSSTATAQAAWALVLERSKVQQGEAARTIGDDANALARLRKAADSAADSMGAIVLPAFAAATDGVAKFLTGVADLPGPMKTVVASLGALAAAAGPAIWGLGTLASNATILKKSLAGLGAGSALAGLAKSLTVIGSVAALIAIPIATVAHAFHEEGAAAAAAAKNLDDYKTSLNLLTEAQLKAQTQSLQGQYNTLQAKRAALAGQIKPIAQAGTAGYDINDAARTRAANQAIQRQLDALDQQLDETKAKMIAVGQQFAAITAPATGGSTPAGDALKDVADRAELLARAYAQTNAVGRPLAGLTSTIRDEMDRLTAALMKAGNGWDALSVKIRGAIGSLRAAGGMTNAEAAAILAGAGGRMPGVGMTGALGTGGNGGPITIKPVAPKMPDVVQATTSVRDAVKAGFAELPQALGNVLAMVIGTRIGGGGLGAQIGGGLGGAIGGGVGTYLGNAAAQSIGGIIGAGVGSVIPVVGTAIGGLLGGAIGGLFGHHKKKVDESADALARLAQQANKVTQAIYSLPVGLKLAGYRFNASAPESPPDRHSPPGTPGRGAPPAQPPGAGGNGFTFTGPVTIVANDPQTLFRQIGDYALRQTARGGSTGFQVAAAGA